MIYKKNKSVLAFINIFKNIAFIIYKLNLEFKNLIYMLPLIIRLLLMPFFDNSHLLHL